MYPNCRALVVSTENITQNWYFGEERSMLIPNCLFRIGGAAIVLSNRCLRGQLNPVRSPCDAPLSPAWEARRYPGGLPVLPRS